MSNNLSKFRAYLEDSISRRKMIRILDKVGEDVKEDIKSLAPIDTGRYRESITKSSIEENGDSYSISIYTDLNSGWKGVALGYLLEWGTGIKGEETNQYDHGYPYRTTPWVYYNERYGRWIFTHGNIARPHFYPGLKLNEKNFRETILKEMKRRW